MSVFSTDARRLGHLLVAKRAEILKLASQYHLVLVGVFGSVARGTSGPDSDVDLVVRTSPKRVLIATSDQAGFEDAVTELLGVPVDVVDEVGLQQSPNRFVRAILDQVVQL